MKFSTQIFGYTVNEKCRKRRSDPTSTAIVLELSDGSVRHRTCFNASMQIVKDEVLAYPVDLTDANFDEDTLLFNVEAQ